MIKQVPKVFHASERNFSCLHEGNDQADQSSCNKKYARLGINIKESMRIKGEKQKKHIE
jgi:hypothetical protein